MIFMDAKQWAVQNEKSLSGIVFRTFELKKAFPFLCYLNNLETFFVLTGAKATKFLTVGNMH